jgi:hypothetical protein
MLRINTITERLLVGRRGCLECGDTPEFVDRDGDVWCSNECRVEYLVGCDAAMLSNEEARFVVRNTAPLDGRHARPLIALGGCSDDCYPPKLVPSIQFGGGDAL